MHVLSHRSEFPRIVRKPGILLGEPIIKGTRVPVRAIVEYYRIYGDRARIHAALPHLELADIEEALRYYDSHREEIDGYIAANDAD